MSYRFHLVIGFVALLALSAAASSQEICVSCSGPDRTYRCQIAGASGAQPIKHADKVAQYICITELARKGNHAACAVRRDGFSNCLGDLEVVKAGGQPVPPAGAAESTNVTDPQPKSSVAPTEEPPKTMVELAKRTGAASKDQLDKTGNAVGGAVKKSWDCVVSLFKSC